MNALDLLKMDHRAVDELFQRIESTPPSKHPPIFKKIKDELDAHARVEEKLFYPALKAKGDKALVDITAEGIEEHAQIKKFLKEIAGSTSTEKREAKLKVLIEDTRHHVKEEEGEMFSLVEDQFSTEELEALGSRMETEKKKFQKAKKIPARREEPKGAIASVLEKAKEFVSGLAGGSEEGRNTVGSKNGGRSSGSARSSAGKAKPQSGSSSSRKTAAARTSSSGRSSGGKKASSGGASGAKKSSASASGNKKASTGKAAAKASGGAPSGKSSGGSRSASGAAKRSGASAKASGSKKTSGGSRSKSSAK